jgi:hypothetical protein
MVVSLVVLLFSLGAALLAVSVGPAPATMPATLSVPAAEAGSTASIFTLSGACLALLIRGRIDLGGLDGGGCKHGHACPPNQEKLSHSIYLLRKPAGSH